MKIAILNYLPKTHNKQVGELGWIILWADRAGITNNKTGILFSCSWVLLKYLFSLIVCRLVQYFLCVKCCPQIHKDLDLVGSAYRVRENKSSLSVHFLDFCQSSFLAINIYISFILAVCHCSSWHQYLVLYLLCAICSSWHLFSDFPLLIL